MATEFTFGQKVGLWGAAAIFSCFGIPACMGACEEFKSERFGRALVAMAMGLMWMSPLFLAIYHAWDTALVLLFLAFLYFKFVH